MNKQEILKRIEELYDTLVKASVNYDIWRVYKMDRPEFVHTMNNPDYLLFFKASIHAHFVACVVAVYRLYETRHDTHNIPNLLKAIKGKIANDKFQEIETLINETKPIWIKIGLVRNNVFGHQSIETTIEKTFKEAGLSINDFEEIILKTKKIINIIGYEIGNTVYAYLSAEDPVKNILKKLN